MPRKAEECIPADVMAAARRGGLEDPIWYVGRRRAPTAEKPDRSLDELVREAQGDKAGG